MPKFHTLIILFVFVFSIQEKVNAQAPNCLWAKSTGGLNHEYSEAIALDAFGNIYTNGSFKGTVDFDPGPGIFNLTAPTSFYSGFVSKFDALGNFMWAKVLENAYFYADHSITLDSFGNIYTTGKFDGPADFDPGSGIFILNSGSSGDIFISKLDNSGNFVWAKAIGGIEMDYAKSIVLDASGNVFIAGFYGDTIDFDPGPGIFNLTPNQISDLFIAKFDNSGNFLWAKNLDGTGNEYGMKSMSIDASGNIYTTGFFVDTIDFDPGAGTFNLGSAGGYNIFISKLDGSGNFVWAKTINSPGGASGNSIAIDPMGNVYATGRFFGTTDFDPGAGIFNLPFAGGTDDIFILKLDSLGNFIWAKSVGGSWDDEATSIVSDATGNIFIVGNFYTTVDFDPGVGVFDLTSLGGYDIFISKYNSSGNFLWATAIEGDVQDYVWSVALNSSNYIYITGIFSSPSITTGSISLTNADITFNTFDMYIAKFDVATGIDNIESNNTISLFPNPTTDIFTISFEKNIKKIELSIFDITGKTIYTTTESNTQQIEVNTKEFTSGIYFVQIISSDFIETRKLVVAK